MLKHCYRYVSLFALFLGLNVLLGLNPAQAEIEQMQVCGKYQRKNYGYSHGYKITAFWIDGYNLYKIINSNRITNSYNFSYFDYFLIIPWDNGGFSFFKFNGSYNKPSYHERDYVDQRGVLWKIKEGWDYCN